MSAWVNKRNNHLKSKILFYFLKFYKHTTGFSHFFIQLKIFKKCGTFYQWNENSEQKKEKIKSLILRKKVKSYVLFEKQKLDCLQFDSNIYCKLDIIKMDFFFYLFVFSMILHAFLIKFNFLINLSPQSFQILTFSNDRSTVTENAYKYFLSGFVLAKMF